MPTDPTNSKHFFACNCPKCNGELRIPEDQEKVICMYCGVVIDVASQLGEQVNDKSELAWSEYDKGNYQLAEQHADKILVTFPNDFSALRLKGCCAGRLSNPIAPRLRELVDNLNNGLLTDKNDIDSNWFSIELSWLLWWNVKCLTDYFKETIDIEVYGRKPVSIGSGTYPNNATERLQQDMGNALAFYILYGGKLKKYEQLFSEIFARDYMIQIIEGLKLAWALDQSEGVANNSRAIYYLLKDNTDISSKVQKQFQIEFQPISLAIKTKFPNYSIS